MSARYHFTVDYIEHAKPLVEKIFFDINEGSVHGYEHALCVMEHARRGLEDYPTILRQNKINAVLLAALLHDVDDEKLFPESKDYLNARAILSQIHFPLVETVVEMIDLVSFRKNGISDVYISRTKSQAKIEGRTKVTRSQMISHDLTLFSRTRKASLGTQHPIPRWKLIPRFADRVDALGCVGVARCVSYGMQVRRPLFSQPSNFADGTPILSSENAIKILALRSWLGIVKLGDSTIDYFIKGLVPRCQMMTGIPYFDTLTREGEKPIIRLILIYGRQGYITHRDLLTIVSEDPRALAIMHEIDNSEL